MQTVTQQGCLIILTRLRIVYYPFQHDLAPVPALFITRSTFPSNVLRISYTRV
ncbi:MAG: hypothetical protein HXO51_03205 [Prevotella sp.]|nr:hypothetical protein [Prevotella sp.]